MEKKFGFVRSFNEVQLHGELYHRYTYRNGETAYGVLKGEMVLPVADAELRTVIDMALMRSLNIIPTQRETRISEAEHTYDLALQTLLAAEDNLRRAATHD